MARCKVVPTISVYNVPASPSTVAVLIPADTAEFVLQARSAVGLNIAVSDNPAQTFSLAAGAAYTEERLQLAKDLTLLISGAAAAVLEVWRWAG